MLINEVCQVCGLTKKAIEYYEKRGLIQLNHDENGYRIFNNTDIARLKEIAILRRLDISISDIKLILESEDKHQALMEYKAKKEIQLLQVKAEYECLEYLINSETNIDEALTEVTQKLNPNTLIKDKLLQAFPGNYGKYLYIHFGKFLDEKLDSPEKEVAYNKVIEFLDNLANFDFPEGFEQYLAEVFNTLNNTELKKMDESVNLALDNYQDFMAENQDTVERYLAYRQSEEFKKSPAYKMQQTLLEFQKSNGYYDLFIPNLKILSRSYRRYHEKLQQVNEQFLSDYPQAKNLY